MSPSTGNLGGLWNIPVNGHRDGLIFYTQETFKDTVIMRTVSRRMCKIPSTSPWNFRYRSAEFLEQVPQIPGTNGQNSQYKSAEFHRMIWFTEDLNHMSRQQVICSKYYETRLNAFACSWLFNATAVPR